MPRSKPGALPLGDTPTEKSLIRYKEDLFDSMAGVLGFEPRDAEIKTRCLTAWRYPNNYVDINEINGAGRGT